MPSAQTWSSSPRLVCPSCQSRQIKMLHHLNTDIWVEYYSCERCQGIWNVRKNADDSARIVVRGLSADFVNSPNPTASVSCRHCHVPVALQLKDWQPTPPEWPQTWRCPHCGGPNVGYFMGQLVSVATSEHATN